MKEGQLMVFLQYMLTESAAREYSSSSSINRTDGLEHYPEAV